MQVNTKHETWSNEASSAKLKDVTFPCQGSTGKPHIPQGAKIQFLSEMWGSEGTVIIRTSSIFKVVLGEFWRSWLAKDSWTCSKALQDKGHRVSPRCVTPIGIRDEKRGQMAHQRSPINAGVQPNLLISSLWLSRAPGSAPAPLSSPFPGELRALPGCQSCTIPSTLSPGLSSRWNPLVY